MNKELLDFISSISDDNYQEFIKSTTLKLKAENLYGELDDYSWLDIIEKYIPFVKNAMENPYQDFLELSESKQLYENRFLMSLINKLNLFVKDKYKGLLETIISNSKRTIKITGKTLLNNEEINMNLELSSKIIKANDKIYGLTVKQRLERIIDLIESLTKKSIYISLKGIPLVSSPIHKTNVILEDQNYKKMLELWDFLENYTIFDKNNTSKEKDDINEELINKFCNNYFFSYQIFNLNKIVTEDNDTLYKEYIEHLIKRLVEDSTMDDKTFKRIVNKKFEEEYNRKKNREKNIHAIFEKSMDNYQKQIKDAIRALK